MTNGRFTMLDGTNKLIKHKKQQKMEEQLKVQIYASQTIINDDKRNPH